MYNPVIPFVGEFQAQAPRELDYLANIGDGKNTMEHATATYLEYNDEWILRLYYMRFPGYDAIYEYPNWHNYEPFSKVWSSLSLENLMGKTGLTDITPAGVIY
jgi:hypothetical protein